MSQTVVALPRLVEFRTHYNQELLRCVKEDGELKGFVQFSGGEYVGTPDAKFEVHSSETGNGMVHIRSCYNNRYLQLLDNTNWIVAGAEKPEEDQSKRSCTLLRPISADNGRGERIRLSHVHLGDNLSLWASFPKNASVFVGKQSDFVGQQSDKIITTYEFLEVFDVIDWQSLVLLPKYVAFKGDNDKFLRALYFQKYNYLQFSANNVEDDPQLVGNEIVQTPNGNIRIRNMHWDRYWKLSPNWIWADATNTGGEDTLFEVVKYSDDTIALRNVRNKLFCTRLTADRKESCLNANSPTISTWAQLKVSELYISRKIENIKFRLMDSRIYDESIHVTIGSSHKNEGSTTHEKNFLLSFVDRTSRTWNWSFSLKGSFEMSFKLGLPLIFNGSITLGAEAAGEYSWGQTTETEETKTYSSMIPVPPQTLTTARIMSTRGTCDVPFSYTLRDVLHTGETVITEMDDGVYTGVNNYSIYTEVKEEPLIPNPNLPPAEFKKFAKVSSSGVITPL